MTTTPAADALGMTPEELEAALERAWQRSVKHQGLDPDWKPPAAVIAKVATIAKPRRGHPMPWPDNEEGRPDAHRNGPQMSSHHADGSMVVPDCDGGRLLAPLVARIAYGDITEAELGALEVWGSHAHAEVEDPAAVLAGSLAVRVARLERELARQMDRELAVLVTATHRELFGRGDGDA